MLHRHTSIDPGECETSECRTGLRNRFFRGKRMNAREFEIEQTYSLDRRRLINKEVIGHGVVCGFPLRGAQAPAPKQPCAGTPTSPPGGTEVGRGFGLDRHGREIVLTHAVRLGPANTFVLRTSASGCRTAPLDQAAPGRYVLAIHYAERRFGDSGLRDLCTCDEPEKNYVCETAVFSLRPLPGDCDCPCGEPECDRPCDCYEKDACGPGGRGPHACICKWLTDAADADAPSMTCDWEGYTIDPCDGLDLACVAVTRTDDKCDPVAISVKDACGPRRFVKNNDLLYDLIRGCDLTRISGISWADWHRSRQPVPWTQFARMFRPDGTTEFAIRFSDPVLNDTIRFDTVVMRVTTVEQATGWWMVRRVPADVRPDPTHPMPVGTTDRIRIVVEPRWIRDEIDEGRESWLTQREFQVEIEVDGDGILNCHGQPIDGNAVGTSAAPSGNLTLGGRFRSSFRVEPMSTEAPKPRETTSRMFSL